MKAERAGISGIGDFAASINYQNQSPQELRVVMGSVSIEAERATIHDAFQLDIMRGAESGRVYNFQRNSKDLEVPSATELVTGTEIVSRVREIAPRHLAAIALFSTIEHYRDKNPNIYSGLIQGIPDFVGKNAKKTATMLDYCESVFARKLNTVNDKSSGLFGLKLDRMLTWKDNLAFPIIVYGLDRCKPENLAANTSNPINARDRFKNRSEIKDRLEIIDTLRSYLRH